MHSLPGTKNIEFFDRLQTFACNNPKRVAVGNEHGRFLNYHDLLESTRNASNALSMIKYQNKKNLKIYLNYLSSAGRQRIAIMCTDPVIFTQALLTTWISGHVAVPLYHTYPIDEIKYRLQATSALTVIVDNQENYHRIQAVDLNHLQILQFNDLSRGNSGRSGELLQESDAALILFTSGTSGRPKGAVHTFRSLQSQLAALYSRWELSSQDHLTHSLPLNHLHGLVTGLLATLWSGAGITIHSKFNELSTMNALLDEKTTVFTAVPTIYAKLTNQFNFQTPKQQENFTKAVQRLRLMISGSSALSEGQFSFWRDLRKGGALVERYGMTETGIIASNSIGRDEQRIQSVGTALPGISVKIVQDRETDEFGEIRVKGPSLFSGYLQSDGSISIPKDLIDEEGFFKTGDQAEIDEDDFIYLMGRSMDIIKTGGYKVSALEIETELNRNSEVMECAVVGLADEIYGEIISAVVVKKADVHLDIDDLKGFLEDRLAHYKIPRRILITEDPLPRNLLGKVLKGQLKAVLDAPNK